MFIQRKTFGVRSESKLLAINEFERNVVAKKTVVTLVDDIDGDTAEETIRFGFEGASYEIDLSAKNAAAFRAAVQPYLDAGRKAPSRSARRATAESGTSPKEIRAWAEDQGIDVPSRGRIPADVQEQYRAANG